MASPTLTYQRSYAEIVSVRAQNDRAGSAPGVVLALVLAGVIALDAIGRGVVAAARRLTLSGAFTRL